MPFTPFHMGPGLLMKALFQGSFSLMIFGWTQIVMDIQPLIVLISGEGHLHGFTHTFIGSTIVAIVSAFTGKYLSEFFIHLLDKRKIFNITWIVAIISAFLGSYSHVILDAIMHSDVEPFYPLNTFNPFLQYLDLTQLHKFCLYTGLIGSILYFFIMALNKQLKKNNH
jgi:membrane-bound metal-dependent hydrolase YbcI (DUF457 family)